MLNLLQWCMGKKCLMNNSKKIFCPDFNKIYLTLSEVRCSMSHLNIYKKIIYNNIPISLLLEDDAKRDHCLPNVLQTIELVAMSEKPIVFLLSKPNEY